MNKKKKLPSVKGGASVNFKRCDTSKADQHNHRTGRITNPNIRPELTHNNYYWDNPNVPDLQDYERKIKQDFADYERRCVKNGVTIKYRRSLPNKGKTKAAPIKECVLNLPSNGPETEKMVWDFVHALEERGLKILRIAIHRDEVYEDPDTHEKRVNCHAHLIFEFYSWELHKQLGVTRDFLRYCQDLASQITGMPRGRDARETGARHLNTYEYKNMKERERNETLKRKGLHSITINEELGRETYRNYLELAEIIIDKYENLSEGVIPTDIDRQACTHLKDLVAKMKDLFLYSLLEDLKSAIETMKGVIKQMTTRFHQQFSNNREDEAEKTKGATDRAYTGARSSEAEPNDYDIETIEKEMRKIPNIDFRNQAKALKEGGAVVVEMGRERVLCRYDFENHKMEYKSGDSCVPINDSWYSTIDEAIQRRDEILHKRFSGLYENESQHKKRSNKK